MSQLNPDFSIVIPTFDRPVSLRNCLKGLGAMDYPENRYEVIVVNDGGPFLDEKEVMTSAPSMAMHVMNQPNGGPASARNAGASRSRGRYLAFMDDDCVPSPNWLRALAARVSKDDCCAVGGRTVNLLSGNPYASASQMLVDYLYAAMNESAEKARFLASNNLAVPRDRFMAMGGFDTGFTRAAGEDRDFCRRWVQQGCPMVYVPEAVVFHAHNLGFRGFLRQHFTYGKGAFRYHWQGEQGPLAGLGAPAFYLALMRFPLRQPGMPGKYGLALLMAVSQAATAAGIADGVFSTVLKILRLTSNRA